MQSKNRILRALLTILTGGSTHVGLADETALPGQVLYPAGSQQSFKGPEAYFTGDVHVDMLFPGNETAHYSGAYVTFQPRARTAWHLHPAGQHMIVTNGIALTGTRDGKIIEFTKGETVWCPSNVDHWHGATPDAPMTHLVVTGSLDDKNVIWKEKVSDAEYFAATGQKEKAKPRVQALTQKQQRIVPIAAFTANGRQDMLKIALKDGLDAGLTVNEIKEIQIHLYAYVGFPRSLNGLATFMALLDERKAKGIEDEAGPTPTPLPEDKTSLEFGKQVQTQLSGGPVGGPLFDFAPAMNTFLQSHLFGDLFGRGILDYQSREIATVSALSSMAGVESQLKAHIRIASNVGLTQAQLMALATVLSDAVGAEEGARAEQAVNQ